MAARKKKKAAAPKRRRKKAAAPAAPRKRRKRKKAASAGPRRPAFNPFQLSIEVTESQTLGRRLGLYRVTLINRIDVAQMVIGDIAATNLAAAERKARTLLRRALA